MTEYVCAYPGCIHDGRILTRGEWNRASSKVFACVDCRLRDPEGYKEYAHDRKRAAAGWKRQKARGRRSPSGYCYFFIGTGYEYVGASDNWARRLGEHVDLMPPWVVNSEILVVYKFRSVEEAFIYEAHAIEDYQPPGNTQRGNLKLLQEERPVPVDYFEVPVPK